MDPKVFFETQPQIDAIPIPSVRAYVDQEDINPIALLMEVVATATDSTGGVGGSLPNGGSVGQLLAKNSSADGDATWHDLILKGGNANG